MFYLGFLVPWRDLHFLLSVAELASYFPLTILYFTQGKSLVLPPFTKTTLCSWIVCFSAGIYARSSAPLDNLTLATFLWAELGFLGVLIVTFKHTHLLKGAGISTFSLCLSLLRPNCNEGDLDLFTFWFLHFLINWLMVGIRAIQAKE